jgi:hypothetical protein
MLPNVNNTRFDEMILESLIDGLMDGLKQGLKTGVKQLAGALSLSQNIQTELLKVLQTQENINNVNNDTNSVISESIKNISKESDINTENIIENINKINESNTVAEKISETDNLINNIERINENNVVSSVENRAVIKETLSSNDKIVMLLEIQNQTLESIRDQFFSPQAIPTVLPNTNLPEDSPKENKPKKDPKEDNFRNRMIAFFDKFSKHLKLEKIKENLRKPGESIGDAAYRLTGSGIKGIMKLPDAVENMTTKFGMKLANVIQKTQTSLVSGISRALFKLSGFGIILLSENVRSGIAEIIKQVAGEKVGDAARSIMEFDYLAGAGLGTYAGMKIGANIGKFGGPKGAIIGTIVGGAIGGIMGIIGQLFFQGKSTDEVVEMSKNYLLKSFNDLISSVGQVFVDINNTRLKYLGLAAEGLKTMFSDFVGRFTTFFGLENFKPISDVSNFLKTKYEETVTSFDEKIKNAKDYIKEKIDVIKDWMNYLIDLPGNIMNQVTEYIKNSVKNVTDTIYNQTIGKLPGFKPNDDPMKRYPSIGTMDGIPIPQTSLPGSVDGIPIPQTSALSVTQSEPITQFIRENQTLAKKAELVEKNQEAIERQKELEKMQFMTILNAPQNRVNSTNVVSNSKTEVNFRPSPLDGRLRLNGGY